MRINFYIIFIIVLFVSISCNDKTVNPIPDPEPEPCEVPKYNQYTMFSGAIRIYNISGDGKFIFYSKLVNEEDYRIVTILNTVTNEKKNIRIDSLIDGNLEAPYIRVLMCPYDNNIVLFELIYYPMNSNVNSVRFFNYRIKENTFTDITASDYFITGIKNFSNFDRIWHSNSTPNNDFITILDKGVYHLQSWEQRELPNNNLSQRAISLSGKYELVRIKTDTMISLNGINITNPNEFKRLYQFSPDEKYFTFIEDTRFDTLNPFTFVQKLHIYDVEKTISTGKAVLHKTIDLPKDLCAFQFTNYVITPKNTIYISMSRFDFMPMKNLYEIDFNGKILRQLTNE
jgi:hypothetical protein